MRFRSRHGLIVASFVAAVAAACGGPKAPAETPPAASASAEPAPPPPTESAAPAPSAEAPAPSATAPVPAAAASAEAPKPSWDAMTVDQKKEVMKTQVIPQMAQLFTSFDPKRFAEVRCGTCHGAGAKEGKFTMPNPHLPKLDPTNGFEKHKKKDAKILAFMTEQVSPTMAKIIGEPPYDPATQKGFGCFNCHTMAGK
jgi:hypothetical protein